MDNLGYMLEEEEINLLLRVALGMYREICEKTYRHSQLGLVPTLNQLIGMIFAYANVLGMDMKIVADQLEAIASDCMREEVKHG